MYVDYFILTGNNATLLNNFTTQLAVKFSIKDLGDPSYFLGMEVLPQSTRILLS